MFGLKTFNIAMRISLIRTMAEAVSRIDYLPEAAQIALLEAILGTADAACGADTASAGAESRHWAANVDVAAVDRPLGTILAERFWLAVDELQAGAHVPNCVQTLADGCLRLVESAGSGLRNPAGLMPHRP